MSADGRSPNTVATRWDTVLLALAVAVGCKGEKRMDPDQQIYFVERCQQARRRALEAPAAERARAIDAWVMAISAGNGLCRNELSDALIIDDEPTHRLAIEALQRASSTLDLQPQLLATLASDKPEHRARARAALRAITDQDFGEDRAAWTAWSNMPAAELANLSRACEAARDRAYAAAPAEREAAVAAWAEATRRAKKLCTPYAALVTGDDAAAREVALELVRRVGLRDWRYLQRSLTEVLTSAGTTAGEKARAASALEALTGQGFGLDAAAWNRWFATMR